MAAHSEFAPEASPIERRQDAYVWRLLMTGMSFVLFGLGAVVVGVVLLPLVRIFQPPASASAARARGDARSLRLFVAIACRSGAISYEFHGVERLGLPGQLIVANHPTLIDVVFLLAFMPGASCVVKQGLWRNPLTRCAVTLAEYIPNDSTAGMIEAPPRAARRRRR